MTNSTIPIIYASTSGNVESVCFAVSDFLAEKGIATTLHRSEKTPSETISDNNLFIFAASTWEHGVMNPFFEPVMDVIKNTDMTRKKACFIGLGDMRYEKVLFNKAIEQIREVFLNQGGSQVGVTLKINGEPYHQINTIIKNWVDKTTDLIKNEL